MRAEMYDLVQDLDTDFEENGISRGLFHPINIKLKTLNEYSIAF